MRRRMLRMVAAALLAPAAARATGMVADRLEAANGPSTVSRSLRRAGRLASRRR